MPRRDFLAMAAAAVAASRAVASGASPPTGNVKIQQIDIYPVRYPMTGYFKFFTGPHGAQGREAVLVKLTADDGTIGWGQSVPLSRWSYETLDSATVVLRDYFGPALIGCDALDIETAQGRLDAALAPGFTTAMPITRAGIDLALHDLAGKLQGKSLAELWGRTPGKPLTLSWTLNPRGLDEVDGLIEAGRKRGYRNFNIKVSPDPKFDVRLARMVKERVPDGFLWADANGGYDEQTALDVCPKLADAGVDVLEAPLKPNRLSGYQALKKQGALPIYMDEGVISPVELEEFIRLKMLDGVAMKPARCGGLVSARKQIELLLDRGLKWLGSGLTDPDISLAASLCLYGTYGQQRPCALNGPQFLTADVLARPLAIRDGMAEIPQGPGLGIEVDQRKVDALVKNTPPETGNRAVKVHGGS